jgi:hypothetical protein
MTLKINHGGINLVIYAQNMVLKLKVVQRQQIIVNKRMKKQI